MKRAIGKTLIATTAMALALSLAACGDDDDDGAADDTATPTETETEMDESLSGEIVIDGSSTVAPLSEAAAELFSQEHPDVNVSVGVSGTGGGFERFCAGETDISDASRPIAEDEVAACEEAGIEYEEVQVANDALSVIVNPENPLTCISVESLNQIWGPDSTVANWSEVQGLDAQPEGAVTLYGPGSDSGTFDYFTDEVNGEEGAIRPDYTSIGEDDQAAINAVSGEAGAMAFIPFSFVQVAGDAVKPLEIVNPDTSECVAPSIDNVLAGNYTPLARPLFIYPKAESLQRPEVLAFVEFYLENQEQLTTQLNYVPMNEEQLADSQAKVASLAGS